MIKLDQLKNTDDFQKEIHLLSRDILQCFIDDPIDLPYKDLIKIIIDTPIHNLQKNSTIDSTLSSICRLLILLGGIDSYNLALGLSNKIFDLKRDKDSQYCSSYLYKGLAQIGIGNIDLGIKNVINGLSISDNSFEPLDLSLANFGLMSAAIMKRDITLSLTFNEKWFIEAQKGNLISEMIRSKIAAQFIYIVKNDQDMSKKNLLELLQYETIDWEHIIRFLNQWTNNESPQSCNMESVYEPYPIFLGIDWRCKDIPEKGLNLSCVCYIKRKFHSIDDIKALPVSKLVEYINVFARWELSEPVHQFEMVLKEQSPNDYFQLFLNRMIGKYVYERLISQNNFTIDTKKDAIIWVMDVRGYSALSENLKPHEIFQLLNPLFKILNEALEEAGGMITEFIGDSIIIVFNTFKGQESPPLTILAQTITALQSIYVLNSLSIQTKKPELSIGVGISKGAVAVGTLGGLKRSHLTTLGNTINTAARIEGLTKNLPGVVAVESSFFDFKEPDVWSNPLNVNFSLRDCGRHAMKNISKPAHLFSIRPLINYWVDFVPMGFVASPEDGVIYIDTGNSNVQGIIDHHYKGCQYNSACELLLNNPHLLFEHIKGTPSSQIEFRLHSMPDLDCSATFYTACELIDITPRKDTLNELSIYVNKIDMGYIPEPEHLSDSLYGVFLAHQVIVRNYFNGLISDIQLLEAGLRVIDASMYLLEKYGHDLNLTNIFKYNPDWFKDERLLIKEDYFLYQEDIKLRSHRYKAFVNGSSDKVEGLWLESPKSILFKLWARNDNTAIGGKGFGFLTVDWSKEGRNRFVISVDPESDYNLDGLGLIMEEHESKKRLELGKVRPIHPKRYPTSNSDPWYFGQGHKYTIIDSPNKGTVLTAKEVQEIHERWKDK